MDIAGMSVVLANHSVRRDASMAMMSKTMDVMEDQNAQLIEMLNRSTDTPHPTSGRSIDLNI